MIRIVSLALVSLALLVGSASAEHAWVLWRYSNPPEKYDLELARPIWRECVERVQVFAQILKERGYTVNAETREAIGQRDGQFVQYFRLPDTIDPRGPKGR